MKRVRRCRVLLRSRPDLKVWALVLLPEQTNSSPCSRTDPRPFLARSGLTSSAISASSPY